MKKLISSLLISIIILASCVVSNAANVANLAFTSNSTSVDVGSEITIYLEINSLSGVSELYGIAGKLQYDSNIFELVNVTGENNWKVSKGSILSMISDDPITSGKVIKVVLKAIKAPDAGSSALTLTNLSVTDNIDEYEQSNVTYTINVKETSGTPTPENPTPENPEPENPTPENPTPENPTPENPTPENPEPENPNPENPTPTQNTTSNMNNTSDNTVSKVKLPAAGLNLTIVLLITLGVIIGVASFLRYKKIKLK